MSGPSKARIVGFRVVAGLTILMSMFALVVAGASFRSESRLHLAHNLSIAIVALLMMTIPLVLNIRSPERYVASFRVWVALCLAGVVAGILNGDLLKPEGYLVSTVLGVLTYVLNPAMKEVNRCVKANVLQLALGAVALVPAFIFAMSQADIQKASDPAVNQHAEFHHYSSMGWVALSIGLAAIAASFPAKDKAIASRSVGLAALLLGALALIFPRYEGAYDTPWAATAIVFGIAYVALGEMKGRQSVSATPVHEADAASSA